MARQSKNPVEIRWKRCVVQNVTHLLLLRHLQSLLCTIIKNTHVYISPRHLTEGTGASEVGLILRSIGERVEEGFILFVNVSCPSSV